MLYGIAASAAAVAVAAGVSAAAAVWADMGMVMAAFNQITVRPQLSSSAGRLAR
jgi:hypothetical protein